MLKNNPNYSLVYTDDPRLKNSPGVPGTRKARIRLEKKGRAGKTVTIIEGLALSDDLLKGLLKELQQACGTGGTVKEHHLELQGDWQEKVKPVLRQKGYKI